MTLEQYAAIAEIIGVSLVIASLIYVAQQLRQNTEMMRAESRNQIVLGHQQELFTLVRNPDIWKGMSDEELDDESVRLNMWLTASLRAREHEWFQVRHGPWTRRRGRAIRARYQSCLRVRGLALGGK